MTATLTAPTIVRPKLHDTLVSTKDDWKFCRVFGNHQGRPLDIIVEPSASGVGVSDVTHPKDSIHELYFCANGIKSVDNITNAFKPTVGNDFSVNTDGLRQIHVRAETVDAAKEIEDLISTLARDSQ